jgi:hypothetical protein
MTYEQLLEKYTESDDAKALPEPRGTRRVDSIQQRYVGKNRRLKVSHTKFPTVQGTDIRRYYTQASPSTVEEIRTAMRRDRY